MMVLRLVMKLFYNNFITKLESTKDSLWFTQFFEPLENLVLIDTPQSTSKQALTGQLPRLKLQLTKGLYLMLKVLPNEKT